MVKYLWFVREITFFNGNQMKFGNMNGAWNTNWTDERNVQNFSLTN